MSKIRRVNLFGGPGAGKSTIAALIFAHAKLSGKHIEHVQEYVKSWVYEKRDVSGFDQLYLLAKQIRREDLFLRSGVDSIVTDSPVMLAACYAKQYGLESWETLLRVVLDFEAKYPSLNIFLHLMNVVDTKAKSKLLK